MGSPGTRATATDRADAPHPPGVRVALTIGRGRAGLWRAAARRTVRSVQGCSERPRACAPCPARDPRGRGRHSCPSCSSRPLAACTSGACPGSGAPRGVRVRRTARHGATRPPRGRSTCAPGRGEGLYVLPRPTQSRPARSARAWWACSGLPLWPRGWYPADSPALSSTRCCGRRGPPACLGDSPACVGHLGRVPGGLEGENPILEAAIGPSATGSGACGGSTVLGGHGEVRGILICIPGESRPCSYGSGAGRVPIARLAEAPFTRTPRRHARHRARSAPTRSGARGSRAVLADPKCL